MLFVHFKRVKIAQHGQVQLRMYLAEMQLLYGMETVTWYSQRQGCDV